MKPTRQEIIELAREHATRYTNRHYPDKPVFTFTQDALQKVIELALERFGAGGGEPVAWLNPYGGVVQVRATGHEKEHFTIPLYTQPSPTDLRAEYLRGLEDAARVAADDAHVVDGRGYYDQLGDAKLTAANIRNGIEALKGKQ